MTPPRFRWRAGVVAVAAALILVACSADDSVVEEDTDTIDIGTVPPTTALDKPFVDVTGESFCQVATDTAASIRVFTDYSTNFGDPDVVKDVYLGALVAFDALGQVATREIATEVALLENTFNDAVDAASAVGWDLSQVTDDAGVGVKSDDVNHALETLRQYTEDRCDIDIVGLEPPITTGPVETPEERQRRVISDTFPVLDSDQVACLAARLPVDFDPTSRTTDQDQVREALLACGIDPDSPSQGVTTTTSPGETTHGG